MVKNLKVVIHRRFSLSKLLFATVIFFSTTAARCQNYALDFYGSTFNFEVSPACVIPFDQELSQKSVATFYEKLNASKYQNIVQALVSYKEKFQLNDWFYYQLIRKTVQQISPKAENYDRYTLYKWFFLAKSGYDAKIAIGNHQLIFYVNNEEDVSDIPFFMVGQKKYMCLNYHDYGKMFRHESSYVPVKINVPEAQRPFSYKVTRMPEFKPLAYHEKQIAFNYKHKSYHFRVKVANEISNIFANYPIVDYETYFNIPLSKLTYESLIPVLKANTKKMTVQKGVDYLMRFTRYAFLYEDDETSFGKEKRYSPEQTLLNDQSDCDDRAALFFYLVKEIYNLPMIAVLYPTHLTMAVKFDQFAGDGIVYKGEKYTICEPTPQKQPLKLGELASNLKDKPYEIVYAYHPTSSK